MVSLNTIIPNDIQAFILSIVSEVIDRINEIISDGFNSIVVGSASVPVREDVV